MSPNEVPASGTTLRLTGRDALPLLHRISTQSLMDLTPGESRATLFCDFRGRLLHRAMVAVAEDGSVWLRRPDAPGAELAAFLDRLIFRDEVKIEDRSEARAEAGSASFVLAERERLRAGGARHGHEIVEAFNPYEVGLAADVHLDKGCYTGQEALQRLITYDSVRRELVRVAGAGEAPAVPSDVMGDGETVGVLTSAVASEEPDRWLGLAVIKKKYVSASSTGLRLGGSTLTLDPLPPACPVGLPVKR